MKDTAKPNAKAGGKSNSNGSGPLLKFNYIRRETLPQTRIDIRALEMIRGYPLYVKEQTDHEPPIGEVLEQCVINTLSADENFIAWLSRQPRPELAGEQAGNQTSEQKEKTLPNDKKLE
ncbi:MAG TPA: hypothetical protein VLR90_13785 [Blastocatellia bacterium]|nr:hypothetical protein [Blastocatellia bacterium]